jgi:hypothetical protein
MDDDFFVHGTVEQTLARHGLTLLEVETTLVKH